MGQFSVAEVGHFYIAVNTMADVLYGAQYRENRDTGREVSDKGPVMPTTGIGPR